MVVALFLITVITFLIVDFVLRKEDKALKETEKIKKAPIFLSPEKALKPLGNESYRLYHLSHSWAVPDINGLFYVGIDNFISMLFHEEIKITDLPVVGMHIPQGTILWNVSANGRKITQLAPISGEIVEINPACRMNLPLPTDKLEKSWILKMSASEYKRDKNNLMNHEHAFNMINSLRDELFLYAQKGNYLNDGGRLNNEFIRKMSDTEWNQFLSKFFPYEINM